MTPEIIKGRLHTHLDEAERRLRLDVRTVIAAAARRGSLTSSATVLQNVAATDKALQNLVSEALADHEAIVAGGGDEQFFYDTLSTCVLQLKLRAGEITAPKDLRLQGSAKAIFENNVEEALNRARLAVRHHQQGFGRVNHKSHISVSGSSNVIVQNNSPGAHAEQNFNPEAVRAATDALEATIPWSEVSDDLSSDLRGEIATIRAQLSKKSPGRLVLGETGRTLRSLAENMAATAAYPAVVAAAQALLTASGAG